MPSKKNLNEEFTAKIIEQLKAGEAPWQKSGESHAPVNPVSGTKYKGLSLVMLAANGHADPRWVTFKQANDNGWRVKKGAKSQKVSFWQFVEKRTRQDASGREFQEAIELERPRLHVYNVFHVSQLQLENGQDIPPFQAEPRADNPLEKAENILKNSRAEISHGRRDRPSYNPKTDEINLPPPNNFSNDYEYYGTALKTLGQWSGHESRLNREIGPRGSDDFAREELRVEIAAWLTCQELGLPFEPAPTANHTEQWVKILESDPYEMAKASRDAEKIKDYLMGFEQKRVQSAEKEEPQAAQKPEISAEKVYLRVPYKEKDEAKALGAAWDNGKQSWFAPPGVDLSKLTKWISPAPEMPKNLRPEEELARTLTEAGFELKGGPVVLDGKIQRVAVEGDKRGQKSGAYCGYQNEGGVPAGWFMNHRAGGEKINWTATGHTFVRAAKKLIGRPPATP